MTELEPPDPAITAFFENFVSASAAEDWARYGEMFLPQFMSIDPTSTGPIARDDLIAFLPYRKTLFERAGARGTALATLRTQRLDDRHVLADTTWTVEYEPGRAPEPVPVLHSTFLLRLEDQWRVAVYLNHHSLVELLGLG